LPCNPSAPFACRLAPDHQLGIIGDLHTVAGATPSFSTNVSAAVNLDARLG
jgi:hypothetical protein